MNYLTTNCGKFLKRWECQSTLPPPEKSVCRSRSNRTGHGTTQEGVRQVGKGVHQGFIYNHPTYLPYMQSASCKMPGWMKHKLESRLQGEISITSDIQTTPPLRHHPYFVKHNWVTISFGFSLSQYHLLWRYLYVFTSAGHDL